MTKQKEKKKASIVKKMMIAVVAGFVVGFICLLIKSAVMGTDGEGAWKVVEAILFQDITATKDIEGLGLFYIVGQLFMKGLQMMIVPLAKSLGWFTVNLPAQQAQDIVTMEGYNPLVTIVNAVPSNMINAMSSNNTILCVVVIAIIFGLCMTKMGEKADLLKKVFENINDIVQMFLNFLINKIAPIAIFCIIRLSSLERQQKSVCLQQQQTRLPQRFRLIRKPVLTNSAVPKKSAALFFPQV